MISIINNYTQWYETTYPRLTNCGLWLRGNEINTLPREEYTSREFRILFTRLSTYNDVSASFTHKLLYQLASAIPGIFPDIAYLPPENDVKIFKKDNIPWLLGTQTKFGPEAFSVIGFSNSIIQEILNIPKFLKTSNIPLKRNERIERQDIPIIILGGANAIHTTSIWGNDSLVDGIFIGTNPARIKKLFETCRDCYRNKIPKQKTLEELNKIPDFYLTNISEKKQKTKKRQMPQIQTLENGLVSYNEEELGSSYLQISEGCRSLCSFCAESWTRKPYQELDSETLVKNALKMKTEMGLEKIDIFSFNFNMYSEFYKLLWNLAPLFKNIGLKSQRFDILALDPAMIEYEIASGKTTISAGLEGISPRLRKYLNKNLNEENLHKGIELIFKNHIRELKIFILSTGLENNNDFKEFDELLSLIKQSKENFWAKTRVIFSITPLVKFPWTPLEFDTAHPIETHEKIIKSIKQIIANYNFESREAMDTKEYLISQILIRASNKRITDALIDTLKNTDFIYYRKISPRFFYSFLGSIKNSGLAMEELLRGFSFEESNNMPWSIIDTGVDKQVLWKIFLKNSCFKQSGETIDNTISEKPQFTPFEADRPKAVVAVPSAGRSLTGFTVQQYEERITKAKSDNAEKAFFLTINKEHRGVPRKYTGLALARALMKADESLTPHFQSYLSSHWEKDGLKPSWTTGDEIIKLSWNKKAIPILEKNLNTPAYITNVNQHLNRWATLKTADKGIKLLFKFSIESPYRFNGAEYLKSKGLKYTLLKKAQGSYSMEFTKDSVKKGIISSLSYTIKNQAPYNISIEIISGPKFVPEEFAKEAFTYQQKNDWTMIKLIAKQLDSQQSAPS